MFPRMFSGKSAKHALQFALGLALVLSPALAGLASVQALAGSVTPAASKPAGQNSPQLRFAQITDAHLFDAGYKCSGAFVEREYEENLNALRWSIGEVNRRWTSGFKVDFVVFTGDLGLVNLAGGPSKPVAPDPNLKCGDASDAENTWGPIKPMDFATAEALVAHLIDGLPPGVPVYFVPGNNDLGDASDAGGNTENPKSLSRYEEFVAGLKPLSQHPVADLNNRGELVAGYTLVGLDSASFKPQKYTDGTNGAIDESDLAAPGTVPTPSGGFYCKDLDDAKGGSWAEANAGFIDTFAALVNGAGPYLVFTHEPDLQEPNPDRRNNHAGSGKSCEFMSTWLLSQKARDTWTASGLNNPNVLGIFAGHFHSTDSSSYGGPQANPAVAAVYAAGSKGAAPNPMGARSGGFAPIFVTPPLAVKVQWDSFPAGARGMSFFTVANGKIAPQIDPYWPRAASECCDSAPSGWEQAVLKRFQNRPNLAFLAAAVLTLLLTAVVLLLAGELDPRCVRSTGAKHPIQRAYFWVRDRLACVRFTALKLLIEGDTQSYSLSNLQFLLWTVATIYGYTYLWIAHTWVQALPGLPGIGDQFPWAVSISGATTIVSTVSKSALGTKGGGPLKPQLSDLISAGGVVAPGRLQFFSWTLVAIAAYLSSILATDPCIVHALPSIPPELLAISGLSAFAYLGTQAASLPGPTLTSAQFTMTQGQPAGGTAGTLLLVGRFLSKTATLTLYPPSSTPTAQRTPVPGFTCAPPLAPDAQFAEPGRPDFFTRLIVPVTAFGAINPGATTQGTIRLQNPDGKYAEADVAVNS